MKRLTLAVVLSLIAVLAVPVSGAGAVMGGERIEIDAPPWVALIESDSGFLNLGGDETVCSGSLVSRDRILTAAHCVDEIVRVDEVTLGRGLISDASQGHVSRIATDGADNKRVDVHPCWDPALDVDQVVPCDGANVLNAAVDIALITLQTPVDDDYEVMPLYPRLALDRAFATQSDDSVNVFGYGEVDRQRTDADSLNRTPDGSFRVTRGTDCTDPIAAQAPTPLCASVEESLLDVVGIRAGDSGAAMLADEGGSLVQVGVVSFSRIGEDKDGPGDFFGGASLEVLDIYQWVDSQVGIVQGAPGSIVRDPGTSESWLVGTDGFRRPIPTGGDYLCFRDQGARRINLARVQITQIPERSDQPATCSAGGLILTEDFDNGPLDSRWRLRPAENGEMRVLIDDLGNGELVAEVGATAGSSLANVRLRTALRSLMDASLDVDLTELRVESRDWLTLAAFRAPGRDVFQLQVRQLPDEPILQIRVRSRDLNAAWVSSPVFEHLGTFSGDRITIYFDPIGGVGGVLVNGSQVTQGQVVIDPWPGIVERFRLGLIGAKSDTTGLAYFDSVEISQPING